MKVIFDFQACQSGSRFRGIGRGSRSLMLAMGRCLLGRGHEVVCLVSEAFQEGLNELIADIQSELSDARIVSFRIPSPCAAAWPENAWRQMAARLLREHAIACLSPDFVHVPALLADGWGDDAVASVGLLGIHIPVSLTQHDLIPLVMADIYMPPGPFRAYYMSKLENVKQADLLLAISEYSRDEALKWLDMKPEQVVHISSAADSTFWRPADDPRTCQETLRPLGLRPGFLLYAPGGFDYRKNLERVFEAYALLPAEQRKAHQLVIASQLDPGRRGILEQSMVQYHLSSDDVVLTDYVSDLVLKDLYNACFAYIFPSLHEGFGLPVLEAMSCGAPVIASNCTSIPEVVGMSEALFDPYNSHSISAKISEVIEDGNFRHRLLAHSAKQVNNFSWLKSAHVAVHAIEKRYEELSKGGWVPCRKNDLPSCEEMIEMVSHIVPEVEPSVNDMDIFRSCFDFNCEATE